jgi:ABC-2 type transport system permease protein
MYRIGEIAETVVLILMWTAIYTGGSGVIKGFTLSEMITYVLVGNLFSVAVRNFLPGFVSRDISEGRLSMFLVKPISYIRYIFLNELGRIAFTTIASVGSQFIVILFFLDKFIFNTDVAYLSLIY